MRIVSVLMALVFVLGVMAPVLSADDSRGILKEGLLGAATGAVAAGASGGKAGKGALIGAGVNVVGGALLDTITGPSQPQQQQQQVPVQTVAVQQVPVQPTGAVSYQQGYNDGFQSGYEKGYAAAAAARR